MATKLCLKTLWILLYIYCCIPVICADSFDCDFDEDLCEWVQDPRDHFDWTRLNGSTPNPKTGPTFDHTSGEGFYVYIDTSEVKKNKKARLISPMKSPGQYCFSLWYYMYGQHVDRLTVSIKEGTHTPELFNISGNQEQMWVLKQVDVNTEKNFKIIIEGSVLNHRKHSLGDIAIDDIVMFSSTMCPAGCGNPTPEFGIANSNATKIGSIVQITCQTGYIITGNPSIVCQANGTWSDSPACYPVDCGLDTLNPGLKVQATGTTGTTFNMTVTLDCKEGFTLIGNAYMTCQADGNWTTQPNCAINNCSDPTPRSGMVNSTHFHYGSVLNVTCIRGFKLTGNPLITCQANSTWTDRPVCDQIDCGARNITNGNFNATFGTTFGKSATQSCDTGFALAGDKKVTCFEDGWNGTLVTCSVVDCGTRNITHGQFNASLGTTFAKTASQSCDTGYSFSGDERVTCFEDGWNGTLATCSIVDCSVPFLTNGVPADIPNGTTYNQSAVLACVDGYTLTGNATVTCQADGNWTALPNCISEDSEASNLIAVYVTIPAVVLVLVLVVLSVVYIWRKRHPPFANKLDGQQETKISAGFQFPNKTYEERSLTTVSPSGQSEADKSVSPDEDYTTIIDESQLEATNNVYNNTFDVDRTPKNTIEHQYDHTKYKLKPFVDNTYSHVLCKDINTKWISSNDKRSVLYENNESLRADIQPESDTYDHLSISNVYEAKNQEAPITVNGEEESEYDHAKAGGKDPEVLVQDEYSHLKDMKINRGNTSMRAHNQCEYSNVIERCTNMKNTSTIKAAYEQPIGDKSNFVLEAKNTNMPDNGTYFVLEADEKREENNEPCIHDYFVLEKTEKA